MSDLDQPLFQLVVYIATQELAQQVCVEFFCVNKVSEFTHWIGRANEDCLKFIQYNQYIEYLFGNIESPRQKCWRRVRIAVKQSE